MSESVDTPGGSKNIPRDIFQYPDYCQRQSSHKTRDINVIKQLLTYAEDASLRLMNSGTLFEGQVEIYPTSYSQNRCLGSA